MVLLALIRLDTQSRRRPVLLIYHRPLLAIYHRPTLRLYQQQTILELFRSLLLPTQHTSEAKAHSIALLLIMPFPTIALLMTFHTVAPLPPLMTTHCYSGIPLIYLNSHNKPTPPSPPKRRSGCALRLDHEI